MNTVITDSQRIALLEIMKRSVIYARLKAWGCSKVTQRLSGKHEREIADLMDSIHNIPLYLQGVDWDEKTLLSLNFDRYDNKWTKLSGLSLRIIYETYRDGGEMHELFPAPKNEIKNPNH